MESDWDFLRSNGATPGDQVMGYTKHEMVYYGGPARNRPKDYAGAKRRVKRLVTRF